MFSVHTTCALYRHTCCTYMYIYACIQPYLRIYNHICIHTTISAYIQPYLLQENEQYDNRMALTFPSMDAGAQFVEECFLEVSLWDTVHSALYTVHHLFCI